jgi:hypothetical protein
MKRLKIKYVIWYKMAFKCLLFCRPQLINRNLIAGKQTYLLLWFYIETRLCFKLGHSFYIFDYKQKNKCLLQACSRFLTSWTIFNNLFIFFWWKIDSENLMENILNSTKTIFIKRKFLAIKDCCIFMELTDLSGNLFDF